MSTLQLNNEVVIVNGLDDLHIEGKINNSELNYPLNFVDSILESTNLYELAYKAGITKDVPYFIVIGMESSGKSFLIDMFLGIHVTFSDEKTGTLCPVLYDVRKEEGQSMINGTPVSFNEISKAVKNHMISLNKMISMNTLNVLVRSKHARQSCLIMDLPGLNVNNTSFAKDVVKLVSNEMEKRPFVICLAQFNGSYRSTTDIEYLKKTLNNLDEARTFFVLNKFDKHSIHWKNPPYDYFFDNDINAWFVSLNWGGYVDEKSVDYDIKMNDSIHHLEKEESKFLENLISNIKNERLRNKIGMKKMFSDLEMRFSIFHKQWIEKVKVAIIKLINDLLQYKIDNPIKKGEPRIIISDLVDSIIRKLISSINLVMHNIDNKTPIIRTNLEEDLRLCKVQWKLANKTNEVINILKLNKNNTLCHKMSMRLYGISAVERIKQFFELLVSKSDFDNVSNEEIYSKGKSSNKSIGGFDSWKAVEGCTKGQLVKLNLGVEWLSSIIQEVIRKYSQRCGENLIEELPIGSVSVEMLMGCIIESYISVVTENLSEISKRWDKNILLYGANIPMDLSNKTLLFILNSSFETLIERPKLELEIRKNENVNRLPQTPTEAKEQKQEQKVVIPQSESRPQVRVRQSNGGVEEKEVVAVTVLEQKNEDVEINLIESAITYNFGRRFMLSELREVLKQTATKYGVNIIDAVKGGYQRVKELDEGEINYGYLRNVSIEYYHMILCRFLFDFDSCFIYEFNRLFEDELFNDIVNRMKLKMESFIPTVTSQFLIDLETQKLWSEKIDKCVEKLNIILKTI
jgi:hypothetical protein